MSLRERRRESVSTEGGLMGRGRKELRQLQLRPKKAIALLVDSVLTGRDL
jgi:hypothetical protein